MTEYALHIVQYDGVEVQALVEHPRPTQRPPAIFVPASVLSKALGFSHGASARRGAKLGIVLEGGLSSRGGRVPLTCLPLHSIDDYLAGVTASDDMDRLTRWREGLANAVSEAVLGGSSIVQMGDDRDGDGIADPIVAKVPPRVVDDVVLDLAMALRPGLNAMMTDLASKNAALVAENHLLRRKLGDIQAILHDD